MSISHQTVTNLRDAGYLVIVWTPEELIGVDLGHVEDRVIELGNEVIDNLKADGTDSRYMDLP